MRSKSQPWFCVLAGLLLLASCSSDGTKDSESAAKDKDQDMKTESRLPLCPQTAIVRELESIQDYGRETPAPDQLVAEALMRKVTGSCEFRKDGIDINFELSVAAERGARLGGLRTSFPYFVAVIDPSDTILNKETLTLDVGFPSGSRHAETSQSLHVFIPLPKSQQNTAPHYQVLTGFQLTDEQLAAAKKTNP